MFMDFSFFHGTHLLADFIWTLSMDKPNQIGYIAEYPTRLDWTSVSLFAFLFFFSISLSSRLVLPLCYHRFVIYGQYTQFLFSCDWDYESFVSRIPLSPLPLNPDSLLHLKPKTGSHQRS